MELNTAIKACRNTCRFKEKKPNWRDIVEAIDAMRHAPMAGNIFTIKTILVDDSEKIKKITDACQQDFISQTKFIVVVCSNPERATNVFGNQGKTFNKHQVGSAIQNFLLKIQELGLSTCWVSHFVEPMIKRELKIPENFNVEAIFPIGYEHDKPYSRCIQRELETYLNFNEYGETRMGKQKRLFG